MKFFPPFSENKIFFFLSNFEKNFFFVKKFSRKKVVETGVANLLNLLSVTFFNSGKLWLKVRDLDRVFNFRSGCLRLLHLLCCEAKRVSLKL
jgi:hypothetical protein